MKYARKATKSVVVLKSRWKTAARYKDWVSAGDRIDNIFELLVDARSAEGFGAGVKTVIW